MARRKGLMPGGFAQLLKALGFFLNTFANLFTIMFVSFKQKTFRSITSRRVAYHGVHGRPRATTENSSRAEILARLENLVL